MFVRAAARESTSLAQGRIRSLTGLTGGHRFSCVYSVQVTDFHCVTVSLATSCRYWIGEHGFHAVTEVTPRERSVLYSPPLTNTWANP
jgi:hypothetical protein